MKVQVLADIMEIHPRAFVMEVIGDATTSVIPDGSTVVIDPDVLLPKDGSEIGLVEVNGELHLCRPMHIMRQVVMRMDNRSYHPMTLPDSVALVWRGP